MVGRCCGEPPGASGREPFGPVPCGPGRGPCGPGPCGAEPGVGGLKRGPGWGGLPGCGDGAKPRGTAGGMWGCACGPGPYCPPGPCVVPCGGPGRRGVGVCGAWLCGDVDGCGGPPGRGCVAGVVGVAGVSECGRAPGDPGVPVQPCGPWGRPPGDVPLDPPGVVPPEFGVAAGPVPIGCWACGVEGVEPPSGPRCGGGEKPPESVRGGVACGEVGDERPLAVVESA